MTQRQDQAALAKIATASSAAVIALGDLQIKVDAALANSGLPQAVVEAIAVLKDKVIAVDVLVIDATA